MKKNTFFAFLGGALVGAAFALLYAPERGSEIRGRIKNSVREKYDQIIDKLDELEEDLIGEQDDE